MPGCLIPDRWRGAASPAPPLVPEPAPLPSPRLPVMDSNENNVESSSDDSDSDDDCGSYSTPPEYEPSPPRSRMHPDEDDPEYDPTVNHQNDDQSPVYSPPRHRRTSTLHEEEVATSVPQPLATTASSSNPKRKRSLVIEELGAKGEPILPEGISAMFQNICGDIKKVPSTTKDVLWVTLKERFTFPEGQEKFARNFAEGLLGRCFRNWRSTLNKEYVQKGKNARDDFGKIPLECGKKKSLSEENTAKTMKAAENPHHLGAGGYASKVAKWRREKEERRRAGLPDMFASLDERSRNWVLAGIPTVTPNGKVKFKHPSTVLIYESYRKRSHYKKNLEEKMREIAKQEFLEFLAIHGMSQTMADPTVSDGFVAPSSAGSITNVRYPVDDIQVDTPCKLVIPYGRKQNKFQEVATGMAVTGHVFPKAPPPEYAWVQVVTVLDESCETDIPTDEGIEVLGDVMK
uniref:Uncharacterized protein n=1 Tax=Setaria viridis TaxID=4556 RepID=A0A4V6DD05_SETVI|nr:hypothetical protein SEVIR_1G187900v2 [Setaria viridis]